MVYRYHARSADYEKIVKVYDRVYFSNGCFYVPWIVAERLGLKKGNPLSKEELKELLLREWDRMPTLFKKYALTSVREFSPLFLFKGGSL